MRSSQTSFGSPIETHTSVYRKSHTLDAFVDALGQRQAGAGLCGDLAAGLDQLVARATRTWARTGARPYPACSRHHQRVAHVVAGVAQVAVGDLVQVLVAVLHHGQHVGQHLGGVELVGQTVPDRHAGVFTPGFRPSPGRSRGTRCRRTCGPARGRCPSSTLCGRSASRSVPGR